MAQGGPGPRSNTRHNHPSWRRHVDKERPSAPAEGGFELRHFLVDLHTRCRWAAKTITVQLTVHPRAVTSTFDAHHDAPVVENSVSFMDAHRSQARVQALFAVSSSSWPISFNGRPGGGNPGGKGMKNASFACLGTHVQGDSGDKPLHRPGWTSDTRNFLFRPFGTLVRVGSFGYSLPANIQRGRCPDHRDHSLARLLTFMTGIAAEWYSSATQYWCHRSLHGPHRGSPSLSGPWTRSTHCRKPESRGSCVAQSGAPGSGRRPRIWARFVWRLGDRLLCRKPRDGATTSSVKSRTATPHPQRRSTGSLEKGPPVLSRNMTRHLLLAHSFNVSHELCSTRGSTASHAAGTTIHLAGTMPLDQKHGVVFFSRLAR